MPSTQLMNKFISQTLYLQAVGTTVKVWLAGNGSSTYKIKSAVLTQGSVSVPVTVNGQTSFQVPALGRWSDYVSTTGFTLPGNVTLTTCVLGEVPIINMNHGGDGTDYQPGTVSGIEPGGDIAPEYGDVFLLNFEGIDGSTDIVEEINNTPIYMNVGCEIDTSQYFSGTSSLLMIPTQGPVGSMFYGGLYFVPISTFNTSDFSFSFYFRLSNFTTRDTTASDDFRVGLGCAAGSINLMIGANNKFYLSIADNSNALWEYEIDNPYTQDSWHKVEFKVQDGYYSVLVNDILIGSSIPDPQVISGTISLMLTLARFEYGDVPKAWVDAVSINSAIPAINFNTTEEITSVETIDVRSSNLIQDECTVALPTWSDGYTTSVVVDPAGQYLFDASTNVSYITGTFPAPRQFSIRTRLYFDQLGLLAEYGLFRFYYTDMEPPLTEPRGYMVDFTQEGLCIVKDIEGIATSVLVVPGVVLCNENADWQNWQFNFDLTARTIEVLLEDVSLGTFSAICDNNGYQNGSLFISAEHSNTDTGAIVHMDYLYMTPGFGEPILDANAAIASGQTITINVGSTPIIYTFVTVPTGAANEIVIGGTAEITAANISATLNATDGAIFTATSDGIVVSVIDYTSETVTKSTTSSGITLSEVMQHVTYTSSSSVATLPAFSSDGFCYDGTGFLPNFTGAGTCTQDDFCIGRGVLPSFTGSSYSFITGITDASTDAQKISLLLYQNGYMQWFAPMVAVAGDVDSAALMAVQFVANYINYTTDLTLYGTAEQWADPRATLYHGAGDCEDGAFLLASLLLNLDCPVTSIKVVIGTYDAVGHAWVMYKRASDGLNVLLDWTKGSTYWNAISSVDDLPVAYTEA